MASGWVVRRDQIVSGDLLDDKLENPVETPHADRPFPEATDEPPPAAVKYAASTNKGLH